MGLEIDLIGATTAFGQGKPGVSFGPDALRMAGIVGMLSNNGHIVSDKGNVSGKYTHNFAKKDISITDNLKNLEEVRDYSLELAKLTSKSIENNRFPLTIGGDHSLALGSLSGIAPHYNELGVIWLDAHGDLNTAETSPSGNIHGMILAQLLGIGNDKLTSINGHQAKLKTENIVLIGVRDLDDGEKQLIKEKNILTFSMSDVRELGLKEVLRKTLKHLEHTDGLHLSFDVDSIDPMEVKGTGTKVPGGLFTSEVIMFMEELSKKDKLTSMDLVEVNPLLDDHNKTAETAVWITEYLFGKRTR